MNVHDFIRDMESNEFSSYSLSEGVLNPDTGYLARVPNTEKVYPRAHLMFEPERGTLTPELLREYMTTNIRELFQSGRYILHHRGGTFDSLCIGVHLSYPSASELAELHGDNTIYDCAARNNTLI